jgi:hypothetical protein
MKQNLLGKAFTSENNPILNPTAKQNLQTYSDGQLKSIEPPYNYK